MRVPGSNILRSAFRAISTIPVQWVVPSGRTQNAIGQWVASYNAPITVFASVQAVDRDKYVQFGLDLAKRYIDVFLPAQAIGLNRDYSGDRFIVDGQTWQIENTDPWFLRDGWVSARAIAITLDGNA